MDIVYHPDAELNELVKIEVIESEAADLEAGYPPRWWKCPKCGTEHNRGHLFSIGIHRCLHCGYVGDDGIMAINRHELNI